MVQSPIQSLTLTEFLLVPKTKPASEFNEPLCDFQDYTEPTLLQRVGGSPPLLP
ncbi:MAG: hypothetical protein ACO4AJ_12455 [Prochlorothrix sp.]|nr:hypothetical protein [Prochlorothrix sp.]